MESKPCSKFLFYRMVSSQSRSHFCVICSEDQVLAQEAQRLPPITGRMPEGLLKQAARLSEVLPHLVVAARQAAAHVQLGVHGRRRPGPGEEFWEFRPFVAGEAISRVDWRRSARDDRLYVREREWETAAAYWLWFDRSPSMDFVSTLSRAAKRDRALLLGLAISDVLVHAGERVGLLAQTPPLASRKIILRLAEVLAQAPVKAPVSTDPAHMSEIPSPKSVKRRDQVILIGDFIMPMAEYEARLRAFSQSGVRGLVVLIRDPAEESFPFSGEIECMGVEADELWRVGDADQMAARYTARIHAINTELRAIALRHGFGFVHHLTHRPAAETLLQMAAWIAGPVSGQTLQGQDLASKGFESKNLASKDQAGGMPWRD
jgi:uncharacterized protein (DUF58 family)